MKTLEYPQQNHSYKVDTGEGEINDNIMLAYLHLLRESITEVGLEMFIYVTNFYAKLSSLLAPYENDAGSKTITVEPMTQICGHQAYFKNWSKKNFTNWKEIIQVGAYYFEEESLEDFILEICQVYEKRFSIRYITDVLVEEAVTKLIMDMEHCSYDQATAIAYAKAGEQKTLYWRMWDFFCLPYTQKEKDNTPK